MVSSFVREQKRYTRQDLCMLLQCPSENAIPIIHKLKGYGILKAIPLSAPYKDISDLANDDMEMAYINTNEDSCLYVFTFVGIIAVAGRVLKCYPKYLLHGNRPKKELQQVLKVLNKCNTKKQVLRMFNENDEGNGFNLLPVLLFLLSDYYENGLYNNSELSSESNGSGEILWEKTINETFALLSGNRPFYTDLRTKKWVNDEYDYFKRLHKCILTKASNELQEADLLDLFEIDEIDLSSEEISDFGEVDYILYRIESELNTQFNTRKQLVLKSLYAWVSHGGSLCDEDALSMYGTTNFNLVWETVCSDIMDNQLERKLGSLSLPIPLKETYDPQKKLIDIIEKPLWSATGKTASETLIPDLISIRKNQFIIFDAKYYNSLLYPGQTPKAQPGIESVTKQFLYQLAYQRFILDHKFSDVKNCFLMPTEQNNIIDNGVVSMKMFSDIGLESIKVRLLPASIAYEHYLSGQKMDISKLKL